MASQSDGQQRISGREILDAIFPERRGQRERGDISEEVRSRAFSGDLEGALALILGEQARRSQLLFEEGTPLRQRAQGTLMAQLERGVLPTPAVSGLADVQNPFRRRFSFAAPEPDTTAARASEIAEAFRTPPAPAATPAPRDPSTLPRPISPSVNVAPAATPPATAPATPGAPRRRLLDAFRNLNLAAR